MQNNFYFKGNFSNIYKKPSKFSEITSQILYGEKFKILSINKKWIKIKVSFDNYIGYIKNAKYVKKFKPNYKVINLKEKNFYLLFQSLFTFIFKYQYLTLKEEYLKKILEFYKPRVVIGHNFNHWIYEIKKNKYC